MATEAEITTIAGRIYTDAGDLVTEVKRIKTETAPLVVTAKQDRDAAEKAYLDTKALADAIGVSAGSSGRTVIALLHLDEAADGTHPATWVNSVPGGPVFNNWGNNKSLGGGSWPATPFGVGMNAESVEGGTVAITSATLITFAGDFSIESCLSTLDQDRNLMQFSTDGTDSGEMRLVVGCRVDGNDGTYRMVCYVKNGGQTSEAFYTPPLLPMTIGGLPDAYHFALQRESGILTFRSNGSLVSTASVAFNGTLTGYLDPFGSYARVWDGAEGMYRSKVSEIRVTDGRVYTGPTYAVPTARLTTAI